MPFVSPSHHPPATSQYLFNRYIRRGQIEPMVGQCEDRVRGDAARFLSSSNDNRIVSQTFGIQMPKYSTQFSLRFI